MLIVTIVFSDGQTKQIKCKKVIHAENGLEKLVIDDEVTEAYPVHRIRKIIYEKE